MIKQKKFVNDLMIIRKENINKSLPKALKMKENQMEAS